MSMDVHASLRYLRMSPRKVRLIVDAIRGLSATEAETRLTFMKPLAAQPVLKLLRSGMANAEHNFHLRKQDLNVQKITADGGPTLKRFRSRAMGRAAPIRKRTTHIYLVLSTKEAVTDAHAAVVNTTVAAPIKPASRRKTSPSP